MSSYAGQCYYCKKHVMHKTLFGTLHVCLHPVERQIVDQQNTDVSSFFKKIPGANKPALRDKGFEI